MRVTIYRLAGVALMCGTLLLSVKGQQAEISQEDAAITPTSAFRELASQCLVAFNEAADQKAAHLARALESNWDRGSGSVRVTSPGVWAAADRAMDVFIEPIISHSSKPIERGSARAAYDAYLRTLDDVDKQWVDKSLNVHKSASGVVVIVTKPSTGRQPKPGEIVTLKIRGFANGSEFPTSNPGDPEWIWLLADRHSPGFIEAMTSLHAGESAIIVVPPGLGFGPNGSRKGLVPPNALLTYLVDVHDVKARELVDVFHQTMETQGVNAALAQFKTLRDEGFPDILCNEQQVNALGYEFLEKGDVGNAINILTLNAELFPKSGNVYDSLGEAYAKSGQQEQAIANYRKALVIDPKMESSVNALKGLEGK